jgi:2-dehydro-3-deoxygluconokinase
MTRRVLAGCDLFLPSVDEVTLLTGLETPEAIIAWAHAQGARAVVLKLGALGCVVSDGVNVTPLPSLRVTPVDATGAGDCFAGACLAQLARGATLVEAARVANVAAALSTKGFGAVEPLPRWAQIQPWLADMPLRRTGDPTEVGNAT